MRNEADTKAALIDSPFAECGWTHDRIIKKSAHSRTVEVDAIGEGCLDLNARNRNRREQEEEREPAEITASSLETERRLLSALDELSALVGANNPASEGDEET